MRLSVSGTGSLWWPPACASPQRAGQPDLGVRRRLQARPDDILDRAWDSNYGLHLWEFEQRLAGFCLVHHVLAVIKATMGLQLVVRTPRLTGEVILCPSQTFVATAHCLEMEGARPVFADIDPATHNLDPAAVECAITSRTTALMRIPEPPGSGVYPLAESVLL